MAQKNALHNIFDICIDNILPPRCVVTGDIVEKQGVISAKAWQDLEFISQPHCITCGFPFDYQFDKDSTCTSCLDHQPPYQSHRSVVTYNTTSRAIILGFKHADKTHAVSSFTPWLKRAGEDILKNCDALIPVPLHYWRLVYRRYNQSALIAKALGDAIEKPVWLNHLKRIKATPSQGRLKAKERHKNVKRAFAVNEQNKQDIKGKTIVLIDDVYTTGATIKECSKTLLKAGAKEVRALTLARVVRDEFKF